MCGVVIIYSFCLPVYLPEKSDTAIQWIHGKLRCKHHTTISGILGECCDLALLYARIWYKSVRKSGSEERERERERERETLV